ncbi:MAG: hypothetical protein HZB68_00465 [Candidatus Aenigmarchaeota archaeon]|nr:hypothetical protein [Candidatus Aenigmarchaeota archaeon]
MVMADTREIRVDSIKVSTVQITDALVVGDDFTYEINITNTGNEKIQDTFTVSIFNPKNEIIMNTIFTQSIEPSKTLTLIPGSMGKTLGFSYFAFDGNYKLEIKAASSTNLLKGCKDDLTIPTPYCKKSLAKEMICNWCAEHELTLYAENVFPYFFDVMPRWQYGVLVETRKTNWQIWLLTIVTVILTVITAIEPANKLLKKMKK